MTTNEATITGTEITYEVGNSMSGAFGGGGYYVYANGESIGFYSDHAFEVLLTSEGYTPADINGIRAMLRLAGQGQRVTFTVTR